MSVTSKQKLVRKLKRKEYRDAYVEESLRTSLPFQIRALREKRGWSQAELAERMGTRQSVVSRLENTDNVRISISTLLKIASAFDISLAVRFESFTKLLTESEDLSPEALCVKSFDEENILLEAYASGTYKRVTNIGRVPISTNLIEVEKLAPYPKINGTLPERIFSTGTTEHLKMIELTIIQ